MTTTDARGPLELYGTSPGISVIDPSTLLTRLWFFDGKFLRAEGFRLEQQYLRALVSLSNQATGHGVVHGFDVRRAAGDRIAVEGGLALAPSGRVVHLPSAVELPVSELVERSLGGGGIAVSRRRSAEFGRCAAEDAGDGPTVVAQRPVWVLTVAVAEALCGEEESFGQLCEGACATETDRETAVEGVRFRLRELRLPLPASARVPFDERHLRSQIATAYFAREADEVASRISGAGLASGVWCDGAEGVAGEEIPLAVLGRTGAGTLWLDMWTARREIAETTPRRYWERRMAMRPVDVFLAHVLQFQCQLRDAPSGPGGGADGGACQEERAALTETDRVLAELLEDRDAEQPTRETRMAAASTTGIAARLDALRGRISGVLAGSTTSPSGSLLLDWGHVTLPAGGYLPVDPARPVEAQVRALMGPGVDLRFCAVRPDFVPEALWEAQHMQRISLTQGIDDPARIEEVDVLVPGAEVREVPTATAAFEGTVRILPSVRSEDSGDVEGSALTLAAVARDQVQDGWSWSLAAHGEAPHRLAVGSLVGAAVAGAGFRTATTTRAARDVEEADEAADAAAKRPAAVYIEEDREHLSTLSSAAFRQRINRESVLARERLERSLAVGVDRPAAEVAPDRPVARDEKRPVALWFDVEVADDLREVPVGGRTAARARLSTYSRASTEPTLVDAQVIGALVVRSRRTLTVSGQQVLEVHTDLEGTVDLLAIAEGEMVDPPPRPLRGTSLRWLVGTGPTGARILAVEPDQADGVRLRAAFEDAGSPRHVRGVLASGTGTRLTTGKWQPQATHLAAGPTLQQLADLTLDERAGALDAGTSGRELGESVIGVIAAELAVRGLDQTFATAARRRLFGNDGPSAPTLVGTEDWVMFHRRRTKVCGAEAPAPTAVRRFRWFHAVLDDEQKLASYSALAGRWDPLRQGRGDLDALRVRERVDGLGFQPVVTVEFPQGGSEPATSVAALRAAWGAAERGARLRLGVVASPPTGDGPGIDLARLTATTSTVSDLVDVSGMQTSVLSEIPPEFQSVGVDGAFFTVGIDERPPEQLRSALVVRVRDLPDYLLQADGEPITRERLTQTFERLDVEVATWQDDTWTNQEQIVRWWDGAAVKLAGSVPGVVLVEHGLEHEAVARADEVGEALGFGPTQPLDGGLWEDDETDLLVFLLPG